MLADDTDEPRPDVFTLAEPSPDVALETVRRALVRARSAINAIIDNHVALSAQVTIFRQGTAVYRQGVDDSLAQARQAIIGLRQDVNALETSVSQLQTDVAGIKTKLGLPL